MGNQSAEERKKQLVAAMSAERGYMPPSWAYLADKDIDFIEAYNSIYNRALADGKALPIKYREIAAIAILAHRGLTEAVYDHSKRALRNGLTKQELLEALETTFIPGGAPTFSTGLTRSRGSRKREKGTRC